MVSWGVENNGQSEGWEKVPASQRRRHGSLSVFHFCQILLIKDEEGAGIWSLKDVRSTLPVISLDIKKNSGSPCHLAALVGVGIWGVLGFVPRFSFDT